MMNSQKGSVLLFTLIVLVAMLFGSIALFRSTDSAGTVAANLAFKDASVRAADLAVQDATTYVTNLATVDADQVVGGRQYYAIQRKTSVDGIVCADAYNAASCSVANWGTPIESGNTKVYYVIDRLCEQVPATDPSLNCLVDQSFVSDSNKVGASFTSNTLSTNSLYYRVTIKVKGASNTESYVQVIIPRQV